MDKYNTGDDVLIYLRNRHIGAENAVPSARIEYIFGISGAVVRQIVNKLRCDGQPICSDANGYYYAKNVKEIDRTILQLISRTCKIHDAARGLALSCQVFYDGSED